VRRGRGAGFGCGRGRRCWPRWRTASAVGVWVPSVEPRDLRGRRYAKCEHLHPSGQLAGQGNDREPYAVLAEVVQRQVTQAGVFGQADAVFAAGAAAVS
jgi:hypothetical protein